ncbi:MAG: diadenylate cyclase CdaA [Clostridia bacterium]|nr:diadenylate cyclase CdaA [Clostridia bacterium]
MEAVKDFFSEIWMLISSIDVRDVVDILIVAVLLYMAFTFIRNRRAGKLIVGVVLLLVLQFVARTFDLLTINFVLGNFFEVGMIALIILFQPELRSALEKMGSEPLKSLKMITDKNYTQKVSQMIDSVCEASCQMAKDKTGALIVIERKTKLGEHINSGTVINADATAPLIENLFFKNAPLHDGAMVIRQGKVYAAGCFLPLSSNDDFKDLGTRHHAAVGVSEVSDAVVVVVSEQTGTISVAIEGRLFRNLDYVSLKSFLTKVIDVSSENEKSAKAGKEKKKEKKKSAKKKTQKDVDLATETNLQLDDIFSENEQDSQ